MQSKAITLVSFLCLLIAFLYGYQPPKLTVKRLSDQPLLSSWSNNSVYMYNYNAALIPMKDPNTVALAVRVQNLTKDAKSIYDVGPSKIAFATVGMQSSFISESTVFLRPEMAPEYQSVGVEDPRIVYNEVDEKYYMFYTAVKNESTRGMIRALLALAVCNSSIDDMTPTKIHSCWKLYGPIFPEIDWSKSAALLLQYGKQQAGNDPTHFLFWGDDDIKVAVTQDLLTYKNTGKILIGRRSDHFDSELCESGPQPLPLADGNYLFLYNSARKVQTPNPKPDWHLEYNLGYAILDKNDPTNVLYRSEEPLFSPELDWETCDDASARTGWDKRGLTPLVIFVEGWKQISTNSFLVVYQGCDAVTSLFRIDVSW